MGAGFANGVPHHWVLVLYHTTWVTGGGSPKPEQLDFTHQDYSCSYQAHKLMPAIH
jgi:hypothetical protein